MTDTPSELSEERLAALDPWLCAIGRYGVGLENSITVRALLAHYHATTSTTPEPQGADRWGELEALEKAATPGPWHMREDRNEQACIYNDAEFWLAVLPHQCVGSIEKEQLANSAYLVALLNAAPALIAAARSAEALDKARLRVENRAVRELTLRRRAEASNKELLLTIADQAEQLAALEKRIETLQAGADAVGTVMSIMRKVIAEPGVTDGTYVRRETTQMWLDRISAALSPQQQEGSET